MYNANRVFAAACMGIFIFGVGLITLGSILPEMVGKFNVSELEAGIVTTLLPFGILGGSLFCGPIVDSYGYKGLLVCCALMVILGLEGVAFAKSWPMIQGSIFLIGLGGGALNGSTSALVADISEGERGAKLSLLGVFFGIGALGMPMLLAYFSQSYSSQQIIMVIGGLLVLLLVYITFLTYPQPKQKQGFPIKEGIQLLKNPIMLLLSFILFFDSGIEALIMNWSTSFLQLEVNLAAEMALFALTIHMAALTLMRLALGFLLKRYSTKNVLFFSLALMLIGVLLLWQTDSYSMAIISLAILGIAISGIFPMVLGQIGDYWSNISGTAFSIALVIAIFGNMLINYLMGLLSHEFDVGVLPILLFICILLCTTVMVFARKQFK